MPYVERLAHCFASRVVFLQVVETNFIYIGEYSYYTDAGLDEAAHENLRQEAEDYLKGLVGEFNTKGLRTKFLIAEGPVVQAIIQVAEQEGADLIAMASHGRTGLARVFYGSVAAGILHQVNRPLMLIRSEGEE